jgi:hypothetical protein
MQVDAVGPSASGDCLSERSARDSACFHVGRRAAGFHMEENANTVYRDGGFHDRRQTDNYMRLEDAGALDRGQWFHGVRLVCSV